MRTIFSRTTDAAKAAEKDAAATATQEETGLELAGMGDALLDLAREANRVGQQSAVIGRIQELLVNIEKQKRYRQNADENIALLERKVAAVRAGAIKVSTYGNVLTFTDEALDKALVRMDECVNCGYSGRNRDR